MHTHLNMELIRKITDDFVGIDGQKLPSERVPTLERILKQTYGDNVRIEYAKRLRSKKNAVLLLNLQTDPISHQAPLIAKMYVADTFDKERQLLEDSLKNGLRVPEIVSAEAGVILMYFLHGEPLVDTINRTFDSELIDKLANWYHEFHAAHNITKGDPRLRNFLVCDEILFGLDLEEAIAGHWMVDIAGAGASLLDTDPVFDKRKIALTWHLLEKYLELIGEERSDEIDTLFVKTLADTLVQTAHWRKDNRIRNFAEKIRIEGLP
ncbi:MAG: hypothetical protein ACTSUB_01205 [Candidatus Thorarchaeota archaeon]